MVSETIIAGSIAGIGVAAAFGALAYVYKGASGYLPFLYANARIAARSNYLINERREAELSNLKSVKDLAAALQNTDYSEEIKKATDLRSFQSAIEKGFVNSVAELKDMSPKSINMIFDAYLLFWEAKTLKTEYRAKFSSTGETAIEIADDLVFEAGNIDSILLKKLNEARTIADMKLVLAGTIYAPVFEKEYNTIEEFEVALDNLVLERFVSVISKAKIYEAKDIAHIFNIKFDIMNILVLFKARVRKTRKEEIKNLLIKNNSKLYELADELIGTETIKDFVGKCSNLPYHNALGKALVMHDKDGSFIHFENELYKYYKSFAAENEAHHPQGPYVIFAYLVKKETEFRNLMVISKGIESGMPADKIRELVV